jgi:hypothetical protein
VAESVRLRLSAALLGERLLAAAAFPGGFLFFNEAREAPREAKRLNSRHDGVDWVAAIDHAMWVY